MKAVDYSERAVAMRIRKVSQLRKLCLSLAKAKPLTAQTKAPEQLARALGSKRSS